MTTLEILVGAKHAVGIAASLDAEKKNCALNAMADAIVAASQEILCANWGDVEAAKGKVSDVMLDRLQLSQPRIQAMADGIRQVAELPVSAEHGF